MVLQKTLKSPLDRKEIKPVNPKGNQPWIFIGRSDAEAEAPLLWPPDAKSWLTGKDPDAGKDWGQEEKGATENEMVGWHHWLNGHEFEQTLGDSKAWRVLQSMGLQRVRHNWANDQQQHGANTPSRIDHKPPSRHHWPWSWELTHTFCSCEPGLASSSSGWNQCNDGLFLTFPKAIKHLPLKNSKLSKTESNTMLLFLKSAGRVYFWRPFFKRGPSWSGEQPSAPDNSLYLSLVVQPQWCRHWVVMPSMAWPSCSQ